MEELRAALGPADAQALKQRGVARFATGDHAGAVEAWGALLSLSPAAVPGVCLRKDTHGKVGWCAGHCTYDCEMALTQSQAPPTNKCSCYVLSSCAHTHTHTHTASERQSALSNRAAALLVLGRYADGEKDCGSALALALASLHSRAGQMSPSQQQTHQPPSLQHPPGQQQQQQEQQEQELHASQDPPHTPCSLLGDPILLANASRASEAATQVSAQVVWVLMATKAMF